MKNIFIISVITFVTSCVHNFDDYNNETEAGVQNFPYSMVSFSKELENTIEHKINKLDKVILDKKLQKIFENQYDGESLNIKLKNSDINLKIKINESFKIVIKNIYCREYNQHIEYMGNKLSIQSIACRDNKKWKNLIKN